ncbi:uncharacterized protein [Nicotiana tomentosiformis]|uniref:uncharacterized protein n=1 Tax=Nicotiana tomentosiformis TaxID=4098 RepID=UPI00388C8349
MNIVEDVQPMSNEEYKEEKYVNNLQGGYQIQNYQGSEQQHQWRSYPQGNQQWKNNQGGSNQGNWSNNTNNFVNRSSNPYVLPKGKYSKSPHWKESSSSDSKLENMLERVLQNQERSDTLMKNMTDLVGSHTASIQKLEMQMRDFSREQSPKQKGTLPNDTIANPKGSGSGPTSHFERTPKKVKAQDVSREEVEEKVIEAPKPLVVIPRPPPPFPQGLARRVDDSKLEKFYDILKQLSENISFVEVFQEMPSFAMYLKDLITKIKTTKNEVVSVTHRVSSIIATIFVRKKENPGAFTIPCIIGLHDSAKALCDNGASINLMPLAIYKQAVSRIPRPTKIPIILGRPFLATERALMDSKINEIKFRVNDEEVTFQASKGMKLPNEYESIFVIDVIEVVEDAVEVNMEEECLAEALSAIVMNFDGEDIEGYVEMVNALEGMGSYIYAPKKISLDLENRATAPAKPSIIEPLQLELKPLPPHLRLNTYLRP